MNLHIGFIGLGLMGRPMALNLLKAGHELSVFARRPEAVEPLRDAGAEVHDVPADLAARADVVITIVSDTPDVEEVLFATNGVAEGARPGTVVIDMSTISPTRTLEFAGRLADRGIDMLDAPVSGGDVGAAAGTLSIMVGGRADVFQRMLPLLGAMGQNIVHVGDHGAGQLTKMCNQIIVAQNIAAVSEAMRLCAGAGVDPQRVRKALLGGFAQSRVLEIHGMRMIEGDYEPGFKAALHSKDMGIALDTGRELGIPLPGAALAAQNINALLGLGRGHWDTTAIHTLHGHATDPESEG